MSVDDTSHSDAEPLAKVGDLPVTPEEPEEVTSLRERLLRALADAENARRRAERARTDGWKSGVAELAGRLIPGLNSLDLALRAEPGPGQEASGFASAVLEGVRAARRELVEALQKVGVERIDPRGEAFDARAHEAVATRPDRSASPGQVVEVLQAGYRAADRLIRPARVVVATADRGAEESS